MERPCKVVQALRDFSFPPPFKEIRDFVTVTAPSKKKKACGNFVRADSNWPLFLPLSPPHLKSRRSGMTGERALCDGDT